MAKKHWYPKFGNNILSATRVLWLLTLRNNQWPQCARNSWTRLVFGKQRKFRQPDPTFRHPCGTEGFLAKPRSINGARYPRSVEKFEGWLGETRPNAFQLFKPHMVQMLQCFFTNQGYKKNCDHNVSKYLPAPARIGKYCTPSVELSWAQALLTRSEYTTVRLSRC